MKFFQNLRFGLLCFFRFPPVQHSSCRNELIHRHPHERQSMIGLTTFLSKRVAVFPSKISWKFGHA